MRSQTLTLLVVAVTLIQTFMCCNTGQIGPQPPREIVPSEEEIEKFRERWGEAIDIGPDGSFTISVTEDEMTALANKALDQMEEKPPIKDLQVHFQDSLMKVYATVMVNEALPVPAMVTLSVSVDDDDRLNISVDEVDLGGLISTPPESLKASLNDAFNDMIDQIIQDEIGANAAITDVQIEDGEMTLSGKLSAD